MSGTANNSQALSGCPFCGAEAEVNMHNDLFLWFTVHAEHEEWCPMAGCRRKYASEAEAVGAWNTRAEIDGGGDIVLINSLQL